MLKKITKWETEDGKVFDTQEEAEDYMFEQEKEVMTHTSTEQPEALRLADIVERLNAGVHSQAIAEEYSAAARELRHLHARVQELEVVQVQRVPQGWDGLTDDEKDKAVSDIIDYGIGFVSPLYAVIDNLEKAIRSRNTAAPQPPEVGAVELPEPFTTLVRKKSWSTNCYEASPLSKHRDYGRMWADERVNVYTEQQVIDLLKSVGVAVKP